MSVIIKKSSFVLILVIVIVILAVSAIIGTVVLLQSRSNVSTTTNKAAVVGTVPLLLQPTSVTAASNTDFTVSIRTKPTTALSIQGYDLKIIFDKTKVNVKDIAYQIGEYSIGLGDHSPNPTDPTGTLDKVNANGKASIFGQVNAPNGASLPANTETELAVITFTSLATDPSQITLSNTSTSQLLVIQSDGGIVQLDAVLDTPVAVNPLVATTTAIPVDTTTPVPTATDSPVPTTTAVPATTTIAPTRAPNDTPTPTPTNTPVSTTSVGSTSTSTTSPVSTTSVSTTVTTTANTIIDTTLVTTQTVTTTKPTIKGNNSNASYAVIDSQTQQYTLTPATDGSWSFKVTTALTNGSHTVNVYNVSGSVLGATTFNVNSTLPNTGILDEIIMPTLLSIALITVGFVLLKSPILRKKG